MPRSAHLFSSERTPASYQELHTQIDWTPNIDSGSDEVVRDWEKRCLGVYNPQSHEIATRVDTYHPLGPSFVDLASQKDDSFRVGAYFSYLYLFYKPVNKSFYILR